MPVVRKLLADDRYAFVLLSEAADDINDLDASAAWQLLQQNMALVPGGVMHVVQADGAAVPTEVAA
ncbi:MAG TPA: hypothetical protein VGZ22_14520, partial [Isosphaeraceae bacterium]|nr:hypothetical protein [Isosphaeraceae bacterium]